jgi:Flp pilus assembly protein TadG
MNIRRPNNRGNSTRSQQGIAMIEFVIAAPVVLFIGLAIAEMGNAIMQYNILTQSLRDGARELASIAGDGGTAGTIELTAAEKLDVQNLIAYGTAGAGTAVVPGLTAGAVTVTDRGDMTFSIQVDYPYQPLLTGGIPNFYPTSNGNGAFTMRAAMIVRAL